MLLMVNVASTLNSTIQHKHRGHFDVTVRELIIGPKLPNEGAVLHTSQLLIVLYITALTLKSVICKSCSTGKQI